MCITQWFAAPYIAAAANSPHSAPSSRNVWRQWSVSMMKLSENTPK